MPSHHYSLLLLVLALSAREPRLRRRTTDDDQARDAHMSTFSAAQLFLHSQSFAYAALHSPFCSGLAAGTLPREAFGAYLAQRRLLLASLRAAFSKAEARLPAAARERHAPVVAALVAGVEAESTRDAEVASRLGAADAGSTGPLSTTSEYCVLLDAAAETGSLTVLFAAAAPCMRLHAWLGRQLLAVCRDGSAATVLTPHREWLEAHASDECEALARAAEDLLDAFVAAAVGSGGATDPSASGGVGEAADAYMSAMRIEVGLFARVPGVPALGAPPAALAADFDGTLTSQPDSTPDLLRVAAEASADPDARADEVAALVAAFGVKKAAHDAEVAGLSPQQAAEARHAFEAEAYAPLAHALRGAPRHALATAGASLPLRPGAMRALGLARARGVATHVVTLCPAADCVRGALRLGGCEEVAGASTAAADVDADVTLHSSVLCFDGEGVCAGEFESVVASGADKLHALEKAGLVPARAGSTGPAGGGVAYVGDSVSDLPAMMAAGLAIAIGGDESGGGASASLQGAAAALGMSVQPLAAATVALATREGLPPPGAVLYAADGWEQISAVLLPPPPPGAGTGCGVPRVLIVAGSDSGGGAGIQVCCRAQTIPPRLILPPVPDPQTLTPPAPTPGRPQGVRSARRVWHDGGDRAHRAEHRRRAGRGGAACELRGDADGERPERHRRGRAQDGHGPVARACQGGRHSCGARRARALAQHRGGPRPRDIDWRPLGTALRGGADRALALPSGGGGDSEPAGGAGPAGHARWREDR